MGRFRDNPSLANVSPIKSTISVNAKTGDLLYYHYETKTKYEASAIEMLVIEPSMFRIGCSSYNRKLPYRVKSNFGIMGEFDTVQVVRDDTAQVVAQGPWAGNKVLKQLVTGQYQGRYEDCVAVIWVRMQVKVGGKKEWRVNSDKELAIFKLHGGAISEVWNEFESRTGEKKGDIDGYGLLIKDFQPGTTEKTRDYKYPVVELHPGIKGVAFEEWIKDNSTLSIPDGGEGAYKELMEYLRSTWKAIDANQVVIEEDEDPAPIKEELTDFPDVDDLPGEDDDLPF